MAHRRVKDIDYDEDEYDEYYSGEEEYGYDGADAAPAQAASQEDELSPEDKEQMRIGTESVRAALGDAADFVTDDTIQEALWHYYYDVAKSVTYLKSKTHRSPTISPRSYLPDQNAPQQAQPKEKKQKQASKFDQAATEAAQKTVDIKGTSIISFISPCPSLYKERHHTHSSWTTLPEMSLGQSSLPVHKRAPSDWAWNSADQPTAPFESHTFRTFRQHTLVQRTGRKSWNYSPIPSPTTITSVRWYWQTI
jgi:hypothetical protein